MSRRVPRQALPVTELHRRYPILRALAGPPSAGGQRAWEAAFEARPDVMAALLGDVIKQAYAKPGKVGQRPMPREEDVDLEGLLWGERNDLPLHEVLPKLLPCSERAFAARACMSRSQLQRTLRGEYVPDALELRRIAEAAGVAPVFFVEYRHQVALAAFADLLERRPHLAGELYRQHIEARFPEVAGRRSARHADARRQVGRHSTRSASR